MTSQSNLDSSTARVINELVTSATDVHYRHLQRETIFGPEAIMLLYYQPNKPENRSYHLIPENIQTIVD